MRFPLSPAPSCVINKRSRRAVGPENGPLAVERNNRRRTAFHQDLQLLFRIMAQFLLAPDGRQMSHCGGAIMHQCNDEEPGSRIGDECEYESEQSLQLWRRQVKPDRSAEQRIASITI